MDKWKDTEIVLNSIGKYTLINEDKDVFLKHLFKSLQL